MHDVQIARLFSRAFNGQPNFMTPHILRRGKKGRFVYELSKGEGLGGGTLYGVSVLDIHGTPQLNLSNCFMSLEDAEAYLVHTIAHA